MARLIDADALCDDVMERYCKDCEKRKGIKRGKWRVIYEIGEAPCRACDVDDLKMELDEAPTIDAEPIRHGKWKIKAINTFELAYGTTGYEPVYQCSECGGVEESYLRLDEPIMPEDANFPRYCPNCGAKMDEVNDGNDKNETK